MYLRAVRRGARRRRGRLRLGRLLQSQRLQLQRLQLQYQSRLSRPVLRLPLSAYELQGHRSRPSMWRRRPQLPLCPLQLPCRRATRLRARGAGARILRSGSVTCTRRSSPSSKRLLLRSLRRRASQFKIWATLRTATSRAVRRRARLPRQQHRAALGSARAARRKVLSPHPRQHLQWRRIRPLLRGCRHRR